MNTITNLRQWNHTAMIGTALYVAILTWDLEGWRVWIDADSLDPSVSWCTVWEASIPWPWHFDQATRDEAAALLCNEVVRRFGNAWGAP